MAHGLYCQGFRVRGAGDMVIVKNSFRFVWQKKVVCTSRAMESRALLWIAEWREPVRGRKPGGHTRPNFSRDSLRTL